MDNGTMGWDGMRRGASTDKPTGNAVPARGRRRPVIGLARLLLLHDVFRGVFSSVRQHAHSYSIEASNSTPAMLRTMQGSLLSPSSHLMIQGATPPVWIYPSQPGCCGGTRRNAWGAWGWQLDSGVSTTSPGARRHSTADKDSPQLAPKSKTKAVWLNCRITALPLHRGVEADGSEMHPRHSRAATRVPRPERPQMKQVSVKTQPGDLSRRMDATALQPVKFIDVGKRGSQPMIGHVIWPAVSTLAEISGRGEGEGGYAVLGSGVASRLPRCCATVLCANLVHAYIIVPALNKCDTNQSICWVILSFALRRLLAYRPTYLV